MASSDDPSQDVGIKVIVTADEQHQEKTTELAETLRDAGLDVTDVLDFLGMITGRWPREDLEALKAVEGVLAVEVSGDVTLPPPDEEIL